MVLKSELEDNQLMKIIRKVRLQYLIEKVNIVDTLLTCFVQDSNVLIDEKGIESHLQE